MKVRVLEWERAVRSLKLMRITRTTYQALENTEEERSQKKEAMRVEKRAAKQAERNGTQGQKTDEFPSARTRPTRAQSAKKKVME